MSEFLQMIMEYESDLLRRAMSYFKGRESDSQDLVQDTILKALTNEDKFQRGTNLRAWLMTIQYHLFVNRHRRAKKFREILDKHRSYALNVNAREAYDNDPNSEMEVTAILDLLREHLEQPFYDTLISVDYQDLSYKEVAEKLDCPVGTVMSRLYRARRKSREILLEHYSMDILKDYLDAETLREEETA